MKRGVFIFWSIFIAAAIFRVFGSLSVQPPDIGLCRKHAVAGFGTVVEEPQRSGSFQILVISADKISLDNSETECATGILLRLKSRLYPSFSYGDRISFSGNLSKPYNFSGDDGRAFDYEGYLAKDDIFYQIVSATIEPFQENKNSVGLITNLEIKLNSSLFTLKQGFVQNLNRTLGEPQAALAAGLVVGEKASLGKDLLNDFRTVGLIHIVVLSGFNITIVAAAMRKILSFLPRIWGIVCGSIGIVLFGILVGGGATVVRSCFMASVALSADLIRRDYNVLRALTFAALLMLIQNPLILLHDPSFQLSFLATLGLVLLAGPIESKLQFIPDKFGMRGVVASTFATQIFVSPYILYMMGQVSLIGIIVNILVLPFIPATMLFVFLTGAVGMISNAVSQLFGWISHLLLSYELFMVEHFARVPFAALHIDAFPGWYVGIFYILLAAVYALFYIRKKSYFSK